MKKLPCPRCGKLKRLSVKQMSRMLSPREWEAGWEVQCNNCCMSSGIAQTKEKAVEVWNALPRHLCWTTKRPTEPGYYWCKLLKNSYYERDEDISIPVEVVLEFEDNYEFLVVYFLGEEFFKELSEPFFDDSEWTGPIPEPEEPK